jgi:hypothetical protein
MVNSNENNKPQLSIDDLFERARNAEPVISVSEATRLISAGGATGNNFTGNRSKNLLKGLMAAGIISLLFVSYLLYRKEPAQISRTATVPAPEKISISKPEPVIENPEEKTIEKTDTKSGEESTAVPPEEEKKVTARTTTAPEHARLQTAGDATVTFSYHEKNIKMVLSYDEVKELTIDGHTIEQTEYPAYADMIASGKTIEKTTRKQQEDNDGLSGAQRDQNKQNEIILNSLVKMLNGDGLVKDNQPFDFRLQWNKMTLNDQEQPDDVYRRYKALYEEASGKTLNEKSNIHIKH